MAAAAAAAAAAVVVEFLGARGFRGAAGFLTVVPSSFFTFGSRGFLVFLAGGGGAAAAGALVGGALIGYMSISIADGGDEREEFEGGP